MISRYREIPGQPHWWPSVFDNNQVQSFIDSIIYGISRPRSHQFTLTVAIPVESGSLHGWTIESIHIPGRYDYRCTRKLLNNESALRRLARLHVSDEAGSVTVSTANVLTFSIHLGIYSITEVIVNGYRQRVPHEVSNQIWRPKLWPVSHWYAVYHIDVIKFSFQGPMPGQV